MRKLAFRYRRVKEMYNTYKNNVGGEWARGGPPQGPRPACAIAARMDVSLTSVLLCGGRCSERLTPAGALTATLGTPTGRGTSISSPSF